MFLDLGPGAWRGYRQAGFPSESWESRHGMLQARPGAPMVSLVSVQRFGDFDLEFQWRVAERGNSGLLYRVTEKEDEPWKSGPEMQLLDDAGHADGRVPETACGALYGLIAPCNAPDCPAGVFHEARIVARGSRVEHWLNGVRVVTCDLASAEFRAKVASSKFRDCPRFAYASEGHLVLQHHGDEAAFRNLRIAGRHA